MQFVLLSNVMSLNVAVADVNCVCCQYVFVYFIIMDAVFCILFSLTRVLGEQ